MKIAIATPTSLSSAIGRSTALVVGALAERGNEVVIVETDVTKPDFQIDFNAPIVHWSDREKIDKLQKDHSFVYQVGNYFPYHAGVLENIEKTPGLVVLHDAYLGHLAFEWFDLHPDRLLAHLSRTRARERYPIRHSLFRNEDYVLNAGYIGIVANYATGIVTHSDWAAQLARITTDLPVVSLRLPWAGIKGIELTEPENSNFTLLTIGHVNTNKKCDLIIEALSGIPRTKVTYVIAGKITQSEKNRLESKAESLDVHLKIRPNVTDSELGQILQNADLVTNLRDPVFEGASASLMDAFSAAKAVVVIDHGHYADLPDETVFKIEASEAKEQLRDLVLTLVEEPSRIDSVGKAAREFFATTQDSDLYAEQLESCIVEALKFKHLMEARNKIYEDDSNLFRSLSALAVEKNYQLSARDKFHLAIARKLRPLVITLANNQKFSNVVKYFYSNSKFLEPLITRLLRIAGL